MQYDCTFENPAPYHPPRIHHHHRFSHYYVPTRYHHLYQHPAPTIHLCVQSKYSRARLRPVSSQSPMESGTCDTSVRDRPFTQLQNAVQIHVLQALNTPGNHHLHHLQHLTKWTLIIPGVVHKLVHPYTPEAMFPVPQTPGKITWVAWVRSYRAQSRCA